MTHLLNQMRSAARTRAVYRRTASEIRNMPIDVALDLDIDRARARRIAYQAVYGV